MPQATRPPLAVAGDQRSAPRRVTVTVPARLHLGLLDLHGGLGRRFGSLGVALEGPRTRLTAVPAPGIEVEGPDRERVARYAAAMAAQIGYDKGLRIEVEESVPAHNGLGSGTQLALATGSVVCRISGREVSPREIAGVLDRGARSGIGIGVFEQGGVLLDGGKGAPETPPPILCRLPFPEDWRILLIFDRAHAGFFGEAEREAFRDLPPFSAEQAAQLCRLMLMSALPALAEGDLAAFGAGVTELQRVTGDHFADAQGGRFASPAVAEILAWLETEGVPGLGQSSWGPTGFALLGSQAEAERLLEAALDRWPPDGALEIALCRGRNEGASIEVETEQPIAAFDPPSRRGVGS